MSALQLYQPWSTEYFNPDHASGQLDFLILAPHGGDVDHFLSAHPDFESRIWIQNQILRDICMAEADLPTFDLADRIAVRLAQKKHRVAVLKTLPPREMVDLNRIKSRAIHHVFDHAAHPDLVDLFEVYYDQILRQRADLMARLATGAKFLDLHSMRDHDTEMDALPAPVFQSQEHAQGYYSRRLQALAEPVKGSFRTNCLVTAHRDRLQERIADPALLAAMVEVFGKNGVSWNENQTYAFLDHILGYELRHQYQAGGAVIDITKSQLCRPKNGRLDLLALEPDEEKMEAYAHYLSEALMAAREATLNGY